MKAVKRAGPWDDLKAVQMVVWKVVLMVVPSAGSRVVMMVLRWAETTAGNLAQNLAVRRVALKVGR